MLESVSFEILIGALMFRDLISYSQNAQVSLCIKNQAKIYDDEQHPLYR